MPVVVVVLIIALPPGLVKNIDTLIGYASRICSKRAAGAEELLFWEEESVDRINLFVEWKGSNRMNRMNRMKLSEQLHIEAIDRALSSEKRRTQTGKKKQKAYLTTSSPA